MNALILALLLQQSPQELYRKCDSEIAWISDGTELHDAEMLGHRPKNNRVDRSALLAKAKEQAAQKKRPILWFCPRTPGGHMNRAQVLEQYMKVVFFTDPAIVELVRDRFVPLRMCCDPGLQRDLKLQRFEFIEPGFLILSADGAVLHKIDRIRTLNAEWLRAVLLAVLGQPESGSDAASLRRAGKFDEVLKREGEPIQRGLALLQTGRFDESRAVFEKAATAEAIYYLAWLDTRTGRDPAPRWRELVAKHADTRWAWRASANLVKGFDTLSDGPMAHDFEDFSYLPVTDLPSSTRLPAKDAPSAAKRAVEWLLATQTPQGAWDDSRYVYCPDPEILPNVFVSVTALAALALAEWRDLAPERIDAALAKAEAYLLDEKNLRARVNEECYAHAYRLLYFARKKDAKTMNAIVEKLAAIQTGGRWSHEYPNPFATAAVVHSLTLAKQAGADVPDAMFKRAAEALLKTRAGFRQAYADGRASSEKNSMTRSAMCELALLECGQSTKESLAAAVDSYWKYLDRLEAIRTCDFHADEELGAFMYFHAVFHTCEAARALGNWDAHRKKFLAQVLAIPEVDGSFIDSHELGKGYGTAMALLVLKRCAP